MEGPRGRRSAGVLTFDDYQREALVTASMGLGFEIETCVRTLGLCGELEELKRELLSGAGVVVKEGGDVMWYAAALAKAFELTGAELGIGDLDDLEAPIEELQATSVAQVTHAQDAACRLAELVKKHVGHRKPADPLKVKILLRRVLWSLACVMPAPLSEVGRVNIEKLRERYKGKGFDVAIAAAKPDSDEKPVVDIRPVNIDGDGRQVEEAQALAEPETVGHYPAGGGEWNPGPV